MAKKSKKKASVGLIATFLAMCGVMVASFFLPAFQTSASSGVLGTGGSETYSMLQILQNLTEGNAYIASIFALIATILAGIMIVTSLLQFFMRNRNLRFINLGITLLAMICIVVAAILAFTATSSTGLGPLFSASFTVHMSVFCYIIAGVVATICALQKKF